MAIRVTEPCVVCKSGSTLASLRHRYRTKSQEPLQLVGVRQGANCSGQRVGPQELITCGCSRNFSPIRFLGA